MDVSITMNEIKIRKKKYNFKKKYKGKRKGEQKGLNQNLRKNFLENNGALRYICIHV